MTSGIEIIPAQYGEPAGVTHQVRASEVRAVATVDEGAGGGKRCAMCYRVFKLDELPGNRAYCRSCAALQSSVRAWWKRFEGDKLPSPPSIVDIARGILEQPTRTCIRCGEERAWWHLFPWVGPGNIGSTCQFCALGRPIEDRRQIRPADLEVVRRLAVQMDTPAQVAAPALMGGHEYAHVETRGQGRTRAALMEQVRRGLDMAEEALSELRRAEGAA